MTRTFNLRVAVILLISLVLIAGSTHLLHSYQVARNSTAFYAMAQADWNADPRRADDAIFCMKSYLMAAPHDYKARKELGFWLFELGKFGDAAGRLEEVVRQQSSDASPESKKLVDDVRNKLIEIYMFSVGEASSAEPHLRFLLSEKYGLNPDTAENDKYDFARIDDEGAGLLKQLGMCENGQRQEPLAVKYFRLALKNPKNRRRCDIYYTLAMTLRFPPIAKLADANECMKEMIQAPENLEAPAAHLTYAMWLEDLAGREEVSNRQEYCKEAAKESQVTLESQPKNITALCVRARCLATLGQFAESKELFKKAIALAPKEFPQYMQLANVCAHDKSRGDKSRDDAIEILNKGVEACDKPADKGQGLWNLANFYLDGKNGTVSEADLLAADDCIRRMRGDHVSQVRMDFLEARKLFANDDWEAARKGFEKVRKDLMNDSPLMMRLYCWIGDCCLQQGNPDKAFSAYNDALGYDPFFFDAHHGKAQIEIASGKYDRAADEYAQVLKGSPWDVAANLAYARTSLIATMRGKEGKQNWPKLQDDLFVRLRKIGNEGKGDMALLIAEMYLAWGNSVESLAAHRQRAEAEQLKRIAAQLTEEGEKRLRDLRKESPNSVPFYVGLANAAARRGEVDEARKVLEEARKRKEIGDHFQLRLAQAGLAVREEGEQAGPEIEKEARDLDAYSTEQKVQLLTGLMDLLVDIRDFDRAKAIGRQVARLQPRDATIRYRLLELALRTHNPHDPAASLAEVDRLLEEIERFAGHGPLWLYGKAVRLRLEADEGEGKPELLDEAMQYAAEAQRQRYRWSRPDVLMGEICRAQGKNDKALQHYLEASVNGDRDPDFIRLLLQMLYERQDYKDAEEVIKRLDNEDVAVSVEGVRLEAQFFALYGPIDRALKLANSPGAYDKNSPDYADHLWHGQVLKILARRARQQGYPEKLPEIVAGAKESLERAIDRAATAPAPRVELVQLLVANGQIDRAEVAADDARQALPPNVAPLALGYIYEALGKTDKAAASYRQAFEQRPDLPLVLRTLADFYIRHRQSDKAAPLVEKLLGMQSAGSELDRVSARRMQARLLMQQGYPKLKEALAFVEQNLQSPLADTEDRRLKAQILLADPATVREPQTLDLFRALVTGAAEADPDDRFQLALLYLRRNEWSNCREQMEAIVNGGQCSPRYLAAFVSMLLDQKLYDDAEVQLNRLEKTLPPGGAATLRAELFFGRAMLDPATEVMTRFVDLPGAQPADRADRALIAARTLERLADRFTTPYDRENIAPGFYQSAGKMFEIYAAARPAGQVALAAFYARRGRIAAAIELLQRFAGKVSPSELGEAILAIGNSDKATPQQLQRVEEIVLAAADADHRPVPLLAALGVLKITEGQPGEAETLFRQVVDRDPKRFMAWNNLAMLQALVGNKPDDALAAIGRAIELVGPLPMLLDSRAVIRIVRNEPKSALTDLQTAISDQPQKIEAAWLFHEAWALKLAGQRDEAHEVLQKAIHGQGLMREKVDPPERTAYDQLLKDLDVKE